MESLKKNEVERVYDKQTSPEAYHDLSDEIFAYDESIDEYDDEEWYEDDSDYFGDD